MADYAGDLASTLLMPKRRGGDTPVEFIVCRRTRDEAEILSFAGAEDACRRGVARALWWCAARSQRPTRRPGVFGIARPNHPDLELYSGQDFTEIGARSAYYAGSQLSASRDTIVMALAVEPPGSVDGPVG